MTESASEPKDPLLEEIGSTFRNKYRVLNFFRDRSYRVLKSHHDVNECDFVDTMRKFDRYYRKQGYIMGLATIFLTWDNVFRNFVPISKLFIGLVLMQGLGEYMLYRNIDHLYTPLSEIFDTHYRAAYESKLPPDPLGIRF